MKYLIKLVLAISLSMSLFSLSPPRSSAHVLQKDQGISVVLHIPPEDSPVARRTTGLQFAFQTDTPDFSVSRCNCSVAINQDGKTLSKTPITVSGEAQLTGQADVIFPEGGVYEILLTGTAPQTNFRLSFIQRVTDANDTVNTNHTKAGLGVLMLSATSLIVLGLIARRNIISGKPSSADNERSGITA